MHEDKEFMISRCREFRSQCWRRKRSTPTVMEAVPAVTQRQDSMFKRIHEKVSAPQAQSIDGRNDGHPSCATENKFPSVQLAQKMITDHRQVPTIQKIQKEKRNERAKTDFLTLPAREREARIRITFADT